MLSNTRNIGRFVQRYFKAVDKGASTAGVMGSNVESKLGTEKTDDNLT